jgi:uncharacterized membrane protein
MSGMLVPLLQMGPRAEPAGCGGAGLLLILSILISILLIILFFIALFRIATGVEKTNETLERRLSDLQGEVKRIADHVDRGSDSPGSS